MTRSPGFKPSLCPGRPTVFLGKLGRLVGDRRRGSPHDRRLRDEQDGQCMPVGPIVAALVERVYDIVNR